MTIKIFNEDCRKTLKRDIKYHYALMGVPDYSEIDMTPDQHKEYEKFIMQVFERLHPLNDAITTIQTDRKHGGIIHTKHVMIQRLFRKLGYKLVSQKIWVKSYKANLFRLNYTFIMTFSKTKPRSTGAREFMPDVFFVKPKKVKGFSLGSAFEPEIIIPLIKNFTTVKQTVFDPFMGTGTTAIVARSLGRSAIGSEIDKKTYGICLRRIKQATLM
jgi:DNA modification methylase